MASEKKVIINQKGTQRVKSGHPWVFRSDISSVSDAEPGEVVSVLSPKGQFLGQAFYNARSQISIRILTRTREAIDRSFWKKRIEASIRRRKNAPAERLIFGESDLLPSLILDRYGKVLVFQTLSAGMERFREDLISLFEEVFTPIAIIERNDPPVRELEGLVRQKGIVRGSLAEEVIVPEGPSRFFVDPLEGQKTGLFLDQADNHLATLPYIQGRVLDLFSYQGGFAIQAATKADQVMAIDSSAAAIEMIKKNSLLNQTTNVVPIEANGFDFLREAEGRQERFDVVILDPPPFVRDRKNLSGGIRGYKEINLRAMKILKKEGVLVTCSCSQNFTPKLFEETLKEAAQDTHREIQILERRGAASDHPVLLSFPESSYLQCWIVRVL